MKYTCPLSVGINVKSQIESLTEPRLHIQYLKRLPGYNHWYIRKAVNASVVRRPNTVKHRTVEGKKTLINKVEKK